MSVYGQTKNSRGAYKMSERYSRVPYELKELKQWCLFKIEEQNGRDTKRPINALTGGYAKSNDESTWHDFDTAIDGIKKHGADGIGFFFKEPYFGIDIDDVGKEIKEYKTGNADHANIVAEFIDVMGSYAEVSPSGAGIHIIAKGELPKQGSRKGKVEMYDHGRFFTVTGDFIGGYAHIADDEMGKVNFLHEKYIRTKEVERTTNTVNEKTGNSLTEKEVVEAALKSKNGMRFKLFMEGGWEQFYTSQSEADMAFANDLAFWSNRNYAVMDNIYRDSSMMRDKWDNKHGPTTYGELTLTKAIVECTNAFNPKKEGDFNIYVLDDAVKEVNKSNYSYDDTGNAARFISLWGDDIRYSFVRKSWFFYNGKYWETDQTGEARKLVDETLEHMKKEPVVTSEDIDEEDAKKIFMKHLKYSRSSAAKSNMLKESQHLRVIDIAEFDKDINLFNVANGYINLETAELHEHDPLKYFSKHSKVEYTDKIDCPLWMEFLNDIFDGDTELIEYLQRAVGYSLSGSTEEQMMFILHGNGRNGKSVFLDIITELLGNYTTNIQPQSIMVKQQTGGASPDIAKLAGARLVTTTEPNDGMRFDEGLVKQMTGGDTITARFLNENEFDYTPQFKLWMATNHKPIIRGTDDGIWRRMAIVPFTVQIPFHKVDRQLTNKLKGELKAILNWAVEGYQLWKLIGLAEPQTIKDQRGEYRQEMDPVAEFIDECCVLVQGDRERASDLYKAYKKWALDNGQHLFSSTKFGIEMSNKFTKKLSGGAWYEGVVLSEDSKEFGVTYGY